MLSSSAPERAPTPPKKDAGHIRKDSWFSARRSASTRRAPEPIHIGASQSIHDIKSLPPLPDEPPRSSTPSSSRSWEFRQRADKRRSFSPCSVDSKFDHSDPSPQRSSSASDDHRDSSPSPERVPSPKTTMATERQNIEQSSADQTEDKDDASSRPPLRGQSSFRDFNENVQYLIKEADEAFKAIDSTLTEVRFNRDSFDHDMFSSSNVELPNSFNVTRPLSIHSLQSPTEGPRSHSRSRHAAPSPRIPTTRPGSVSSARQSVCPQKKSQERKLKAARKAAAAKHAAKASPRWPLAENMSDLFTGKFFQKLEVDEVLSPDQLEAFKMRRLSQLESQPIAISEAGVPSRIRNGSADSAMTSGMYSEPSPSLSSSPFVQHPESRMSSDSMASESSVNTVQESPSIDEPRHQPHALDSIPEGGCTSILEEDESVAEDKVSENSENPEDYVFFDASPCTMNVPTFKHGLIRLNKSDLIPDPIIGADDGLDWTAFQMAILGGAGDWNSDSDEEHREREAEEITDIIDWWSSWDNNCIGELINEDTVPGSPTSTISGDEDDFSYQDITHDNPYSAHQTWDQMRRHAASIDARPFDINMAPFEIHELDNEEHPERFLNGAFPTKKHQGDGDDYSSLPPSPMLDLRVIRSESGADADVVPMGYNLGHDLGDFLKWEAEHAYYATPGVA